MKRPDDIYEALDHIRSLMMAIMQDVDMYMENPQNYQPEYFRSVSGAAADAHLVSTWIADQLRYPGEDA